VSRERERSKERETASGWGNPPDPQNGRGIEISRGRESERVRE